MSQPDKAARLKRAIIQGAIMEGPILVAGGFYLFATGNITNPLAIVGLVVVAAVAGVATGVYSYMKSGRG